MSVPLLFANSPGPRERSFRFRFTADPRTSRGKPTAVRSLAPAAGGRPVLGESATNGPVMTGHAAVFGVFTEISGWEGNFMEKVAPGAFTKTIRERGDRVRVMLEHGSDARAGQRPLGKLTLLEEDAIGLRYAVDLFAEADYVRELLPALRASEYGASFRFRALKDEWRAKPGRSKWNPRGIPERVLREVQLIELGPVAFGAYPQATAGVRGAIASASASAFKFRFVPDPRRHSCQPS